MGPAGRNPSVRPLGSDTHLIDTRMSGYDGITSAYAILADLLPRRTERERVLCVHIVFGVCAR